MTIATLGLSARLLLPVLTNRWLWFTLTLMIMLVMTSGFMFVRIRAMPYRTMERAIAPGFQQQYGAEIWMVATKCELGSLSVTTFTESIVADFLLSMMFIILTQGIPLQDKPGLQKPAIYLCTIAIILLFSALIKDFKVKNGGKSLPHHCSIQTNTFFQPIRSLMSSNYSQEFR
jgi:oligosaccharyltransferase complex subunit gamma